MKNTQRKYHKKIMYTFKIKYFHFQHIIIRGWIFYKDGTWVSAISIIMIEGQVLLSLYTSLITWQLGRHNVFNTSPCCQYVFTNSPRRRQWSSWRCQWSSVHRQEVVSHRQRSWPSCQQIVICTFMCCHWGVTMSSIRRQANHLAMYWRCTGDFWWISSREDGASASPDVASWCERGFSILCWSYWNTHIALRKAQYSFISNILCCFSKLRCTWNTHIALRKGQYGFIIIILYGFSKLRCTWNTHIALRKGQ